MAPKTHLSDGEKQTEVWLIRIIIIIIIKCKHI